MDTQQKQRMEERYRHLTSEAVKSKDKKKMQVLAEAAAAAFGELVVTNLELAQDWIDKLEAVEWNNYLSAKEARSVESGFVSQDGVKGPHWQHEDILKAAEDLGIPADKRPYYNSYALFAVTNMVYSDHARSIAEDMGHKSPADVQHDKMARSCVNKAIEMLEDPDGGFDARRYFRLCGW